MNINEIKVEENSRFLNIPEGETPIRIVSGFVAREVEYKSGDKGFKYSCFVIDRRDQKIRIANFGKQIVKQIQALANSRDYAFSTEPPKYDMTIVRVGTGQFDTEYTVRPARQDTELTDEEVQMVAALPPIEQVFSSSGDIRVEDIPF